MAMKKVKELVGEMFNKIGDGKFSESDKLFSTIMKGKLKNKVETKKAELFPDMKK